MTKRLGGIVLFLLFILYSQAQNPEVLNIRIISENETQANDSSNFENQIKEEIKALLTNRRTLDIQFDYCDCETAQMAELINTAFSDTQTDIIIGVGPFTSAVLAQQTSFPKPAIASLIIDQDLQNVPITTAGTSGKNNFSYIQSPFSFEKDLEILYEIYPYKNVGIITPPDINNLFPNFEDLFKKATHNLTTTFTLVKAGKNAETTLKAIPEEVDAVYVFPLFEEFDDAEYTELFHQLAEKKLPSVALLGESMVAQGALVGYNSAANIAKMPRRIALDVSKIVDGINAADLPVLINTYSESVVINMNTVRKVGTYPNWDLVSESILLHVNTTETKRSHSLQTVIMESLQKNLTLKIAEQNPRLAQKEVELARTELLPQLDANTSLSLLDANTTNNSFGTKGRVNWMAGSSLSQLVYAEPALANVAIQGLLQKGEEYGLQATQLDVVLDAATNYLGVLQARSFVEIQSGNVNVTKNNLDIAKAKDAVGYSGATDLNRWKSELAINKIDQNDAQAQFRQARYALNQFLNHPIKEEFQIEDIGVENDLLMITDKRLFHKINNEKELDQLSDFLVVEALGNLPELKQINFGLAAQQRLLKSQERAFYLPSVALSGGLDYTLKRWSVTENPGMPIPENQAAWNFGLGVQYPILQGGRRKVNQEITQLNILQIKDQQADIRNQLELRVRAALQNASAAYFKVLQYEEAQKAAAENFTIVQDSYSQGLTSVTNLIDAQNAKVQTELGAVNAGYQFILDFLEVERAIGFYYKLASTAEQSAFFDRMEQFMARKPGK